MNPFGKIFSGLKGVGRGARWGLKNAAKYGVQYGPFTVSILTGLGAGGLAPMLVLRALKGGMRIAEAKGGKDKSLQAIAIAMSVLKDSGHEVPQLGWLKVAVEALHDPGLNEGEFAFDPAAEKSPTWTLGVTDSDEATIERLLAGLQGGDRGIRDMDASGLHQIVASAKSG